MSEQYAFIRGYFEISVPQTSGVDCILTLLHLEQPKLHRVLAVLSAIGLNLVTAVTLNLLLSAYMQFAN